MIAALVLALAAPPQQAWSVGVEREVDEGVYMKIVANQDGWRVWRIETRNGVDCRAYKSAQGRRHPVPVGVNSMMARTGTPFLEVYRPRSLPRAYSEWHGVHYRSVGKWRVAGARFWETEAPDPTVVEEGPVEVVVDGWEYPEIMVGRAEERATLDLTGIRWAASQVEACNRAQ